MDRIERKGSLLAYVSLCGFSFLAAMGLRVVVEYLKFHGDTFERTPFEITPFQIDDPMFLVLWAGFFILAVVLYLVVPRLVTCPVCGRLSQDVLVFKEGGSGRFCRAHMLEQFRREFISFKDRMVVFYPFLERKSGPYIYEYRAMEDIPEKFLNSGFGLRTVQALSAIKGRCSICTRDASVAYFGPGCMPWESAGVDGLDWDDLQKNEMMGKFQITCPQCIADEVIFSLGQFESGFLEGIILPYDGEGVFRTRLR